MKLGVVDTTFARYDMGSLAVKTIKEHAPDSTTVRYTVPGIKDLAVACKKLFEEERCDIIIACGMVGATPIDKTCGHEASIGISNVQLLTNRHILEVFVHMDESSDEKELLAIARNRTIKHTLNALSLLKGRTALTPFAGTGRRQGKEDVGSFAE